MKESGSARRLPFGVPACLTMTDSMSEVSRTGTVIASIARDEAAVLIGFKKNSAAYGARSWVEQNGDSGDTRGNFLQELQPLRRHRRGCDFRKEKIGLQLDEFLR